MEERFNKVLEDADTLFKIHSKEKGDSWKRIKIEDLEKGIFKDIEEFKASKTPAQKYHELLDIINWSLMTAARIKQ